MNIKNILLTTALLISNLVWSQLTVNTGQTAQQLAENLAGPNINVFNASLSGQSMQRGTFSWNGTGLDIGSGVILSTGDVLDAVGPNNDPGTSGGFGGPGTPETDALTGTFTMDAITLEFDFEVQTTSIEFNYIFASEEYLEFVNQGVNDGFGFFISGPGITGTENLALIPTTTTPVTIDNINDNNHWQFYKDNGNGTTNIEFDGFTTVLKAKKDNLIPCSVYTLKLIIADAGDDIFDSGVFLEENSLVQGVVSAISNTVNADSVALEGCTDASFTFLLDSARAEDMVITYQIAGSAVNGVDYIRIDTALIIPAGQTSATIIVNAIADGIPEIQETVELTYKATPCSPAETVILYIDDADPIDFTLVGTDASCNGGSTGEIDAAVTGGFSPYSITLNGNQTYTSLPITGLAPGTYQVEVDDLYGCAGEAQVVGDLYDAGQTFLPDGNGNVFTTAIPISGLPGTLTDVNQIQSICLNMEHSYLGDIEMKLIAPGGQEIILKERPGGNRTNLGEPVAKGKVDGANSDTTAGVGYDYCFTNTPSYGTMVSEKTNYSYTYVDNTGRTLTDNYLPAGSYQSYQAFSNLIGSPFNGNWTIWVKDYKPQDNGYIFNWSISFIVDRGNGDEIVIGEPSPIAITGGVTSAACGSSDGAIDITASGTFTPLNFSWSNGAVSEDIAGLTAGSYTVTVTDQNNCSTDTTFLVSNATALVLTGNTTNASCNGSNNGNINLTVTNGSGNYDYSWSNGATTQHISGLAAGDYTVTVTDLTSNCSKLETFAITQPVPLNAAATITHENCGDREGMIELTISGGTSTYNQNWSNGSVANPVTDLQQGTYSVTITDQNGCTFSDNYQIINLVGNCIPDCDLTIDDEVVTNEICGQSNGAIALGVSSSNAPISINWSNGAITSAISSLSANTYTVTLSDEKECQITRDYTIQNNAGTLAITNSAVTNESCGNASGGVNITVSGGTGGYTFLWSNGDTDEDLTNVSAGTYSVTISDNSGCAISKSFTINNNAGSLQQTFGYAVNEVCGNSNGSIDITIIGGVGFYNYSWSNGSSNEDLIGIGVGSYSCTITDQSGCALTTPTYTVTNESGTLSLDFIDVDHEVCGNNTGAINLNISGGTGGYTYLWSNASTAASLSGLAAGTYSCTVSDAGGCSLSTGNIVVSDLSPNLSVSNAFVQHETCGNGGGAINLEMTGSAMPFTFSWSNGASSEDITGLVAGSYTCTITDTNNCSVSSTSFIFNDPGTLSIDNFVVTNDSCGLDVGGIDITTSGETGAIYYAWSNGTTSEDLTNASAGSYTCTVSDDAGCSTSITEVVTGQGLTAANIAVSNEICNNNLGAIDIEVSGGSGSYTYQWSNGSTNEDINFLNSGNYSCMITDNVQGCILQITASVGNSSSNLSTTGTVTDDNCGGLNGAITLNVNGGFPNYNFNWSNGSTSQNLTGISGGTYTVIVSDANGCSATETFTVQNTTSGISITNVATTNEYCSDGSGSIDVTVGGGSGAYSYVWNTGQTGASLTGLSAGIYTVTVTDLSDGCATVQTVEILNNTGTFSNTITVVDEICGNLNGSVMLNVSGGSGNYSFIWNTGATSQNLTNLAAGTYSCVITDIGTTCAINVSATVTASTGSLSSQVLFTQNDFCNSGQGFAFVSINGGTAPVSVNWSNGWNQPNLDFVFAGTYYLTVADANGCILTDSVVIDNETPFAVSNALITDATCETCPTGAIDLTIDNFGGFGIPQFNWSNGETTEDIANVLPGVYEVEVFIDDGFFLCSRFETYIVGNDSSDIGTGTAGIPGNANVHAFPNPSTGVVTLDFRFSEAVPAILTDIYGRSLRFMEITPGITTLDLNTLAAGTYFLTLHSEKGRLIQKLVIQK